MVKVKRIKAPSDIPAEGSYVLVRDGKRDKVKLDEFAAAVRPQKTLRKPNISRPST